jgi:tetratricopeptide (TPR) repeat protein
MFSLAFVRWNHPGEESEPAATVRAECPELTVLDIRLSHEESRDPLPALAQRIPRNPPPDAAFVYGMEKAFPDFLSYRDDDRPPVLTALNLQRDAFPKAIPFPLVFWLPDHALGLIARGAPDFWSFRSGVFEFELPPEAQVTILQRGAEATTSQGAVPAAEARQRVNELSALWEDLSSRTEISPRERETMAEAAEQVAQLLLQLGRGSSSDEWADRAIAFFLPDTDHPRARPRFLFRAARLLANKQTGDRAENLKTAIAYYREALKVYTREDFPVQWATTQNNLGAAYSDLPTGDRAQNLKNAIACYDEALNVYTPDNFPSDWAMTQNNLGNAYAQLPAGDRAENLKNAIACYKQALKARARDDFPVQWATIQNNLGNAYQEIRAGDRAQNLQNAIACYKEALRVYTRDDFPVQWALTQNNLGIAYQRFPTGDRAENLENAIACFKEALTVRTRDDFPLDWAMTQNNLGTAYADFPPGDRPQNLKNAIGCYGEALTVYTEDAFPHEHTLVAENLSRAIAELESV